MRIVVGAKPFGGLSVRLRLQQGLSIAVGRRRLIGGDEHRWFLTNVIGVEGPKLII